jgi:hypothetical protein
MRAIYSPAKGGAWVLTAILVATACQPTRSSSPGLDRQLTEASLSAERDSLIMEVTATGKLLTDIQAELDRLPPVGVAVSAHAESHAPETAYDLRRTTLEKVRATTVRLKAAESRLATTERRLARITSARDSMKTELVTLSTVVEEQKAAVAALTTRLEDVTTENNNLADHLYRLAQDQNTAYYVVGTRKELVAKGVLVEDGHRAIPLVGRRGVTPARELPLGEFTSIDRSNSLELPLPDPARTYRIVSRQNTAHLVSAEGNGVVRGAIQIASPDGFWEGSRYLIVVQQ